MDCMALGVNKGAAIQKIHESLLLVSISDQQSYFSTCDADIQKSLLLTREQENS